MTENKFSENKFSKNNVRKGKVKITDNYYYTLDEHGNHTLYWIGEKEKMLFGGKGGTGEFVEVAEELGYYVTLEYLVYGCMRDAALRKIKSGDIQTIGQHLGVVRQIKNEVREALSI